MPPVRTVPATLKPLRTERTHEENQERAYIAASRRSDRSLEARVESARRASEIHKKRTGRSLRVREEDVLNEEMYEEEDDDLPNQYRRINALNPALGSMYNLNERFNSYVAGQIGVRQYLHQAIFSANQHRYQNQQMFGNPMLQQGGFNNGTMSPQTMSGYSPSSPYPMTNNMQPTQPSHSRSASVATPQQAVSQQQHMPSGRSDSAAPSSLDDRRRSMPTPASRPSLAPSPKQVPTPPQSGNTPPTDASIYPLTTKIPIETQQIIDGSSRYMNAVSPSQLTAGIPMPSHARYNYNPNGRSQKSFDANPAQFYTGLDQTLSPFAFNTQRTTPPMSEPQSAISAPANLDFGFDENFTGYGDLGDFNLFGGSDAQNNSGQITPASPFDLTWDGGDFFNYQDATG